MTDRVHPDSPLPTTTSSETPDIPNKPTPPATVEQSTPSPVILSTPLPVKPGTPPPGTYVIQIPKDQVYRVPPPENARRYQDYTRRKNRRSPCCCCLCSLLAVIGGFIVLAGLAAGIFYLVFRPESPDYSFESISIKGLNVTSSSPAEVSPEFDVTLRVQNPNDKIGIYYEQDTSVHVFYSDSRFGYDHLPAFYQASNNETVFQMVLKGMRFELGSEARKALVDGQNQGTVPFKLEMRAPVKFKVGSFKTWKIRVKLFCDVTVDKLTAESKIVKKDCDYGVDLW